MILPDLARPIGFARSAGPWYNATKDSQDTQLPQRVMAFAAPSIGGWGAGGGGHRDLIFCDS
jgi:hypothetical protein